MKPMAQIPFNRPTPEMKPLSEYAIKQLRLGKIMRLNYRQASLVPPEKIWYLWDLAKPESKRRFEWYAMPDSVIRSPNATWSMKHLAAFIRDEGYVQPAPIAWGKKVKEIIRPDLNRRIRPGIVEPYYPPAASPEKDWI